MNGSRTRLGKKSKTFWKQIFQANGQEKKAGVAILMSDKVDFQRRAIKRDPEGHFIIHKGKIHEEYINIVNIYTPNTGAPEYIKKVLEDVKKDIDSNTNIVGDFTPHCQKWTDIPNKIWTRILCHLTISYMKWTSLICIELFIPKQQNTHSFQVYMEHFQR